MKKIEKFEKIENLAVDVTGDLAADLDAQLQNLPQSPGVYVFKGENAKLLYIGKAKILRNRVRSYFQKSEDHSAKTQHLVTKIKSLEYLTTGSEAEALLLENNLIKKLKPKYNIRLRDDKTYPYIRIDTSHSSPRAYMARKQTQGGASEYFGPYPDSGGVRRILSIASKVFQLRDCRDRDFANRSRPCLSYQMGQCTAPCVNLVSSENYQKQVDQFRNFLKGASGDLAVHIEGEMLEASENTEFERAARLRDQLLAIRSVVGQSQRMVDTTDFSDKDVWAFWPLDLASGSSGPDADGRETLGEVSLLHVLILQFRDGRLVGRVYRNVDLEETLTDEDWMLGILFQYYSKHEPPAQIIVPDAFDRPKQEALIKLLAGIETDSKNEEQSFEESVNTKFSIHLASQKSEWASLYELALENVKESFRVNLEARKRQEDAHRELAELLEMAELPQRLECVDISNFQGEENVASAVVFIRGRPAKDEYRRYIIKSVIGQDDFGSMRELMSRRYGKTDSPRPDLLVIDGGKGQLGAVTEILKGLGCDFPVVGLAKSRTESNFRSSEVEASEERFFKPGQKNPLKIRNRAVLKLITQLRDEAHRFAITFHRERRDKKRIAD